MIILCTQPVQVDTLDQAVAISVPILSTDVDVWKENANAPNRCVIQLLDASLVS